MEDREGRELRRRVARLKRERPGFRFSRALRAEITAWVVEQRGRGAWWCDLSRTIGVPARTLKRWSAASSTASAAMLPVEVIDAPPPGTVTLVSPTGLRIEGVAIADAIAILRGLA
jgi:hypothetical protein